MLDKVDFRNINGEIWHFNTADCPLHDFSIDYDVRPEGEEQNRMQEDGIWPHYTYVGKALVHLEGAILADTTADYVTKAMNINRIILPIPKQRQTVRKLGDLIMRYTGMTEDMIASCGLDGSPLMPKAANFPTVSEFTITFKIFDGYFVGVATGNYYRPNG